MDDPESARTRRLAIRWFEEIWNQRRMETLDELWAPGAVGHMEGNPTTTREDFEAFHGQLHAAFSDLHVELLEVRAVGTEVFIRWCLSGTHDGPGLGIPPSYKTVSELGATKLVFSDGMMVEGWDSWNAGAMLDHLSTPSLEVIRTRHGLTARQAEVADLMAQRRTTKEIARVLGIAHNTARRHCQAVLRRLGVHTRLDVGRTLLDWSEEAS